MEIMEDLLNLVRDWSVVETVWTLIMAVEVFFIDHQFLIGVTSLILILVVGLTWSCLRRGRAAVRELSEGV